MGKNELNEIKVKNRFNKNSYDNKSIKEFPKLKTELDHFEETKPKEAVNELKTENEKKKPQKSVKVASLLASAAAMVVVAVPQIQNITAFNVSSYSIYSTYETISYQFDFSNFVKDGDYEQGRPAEEFDYEFDYENMNLVVTVYNDFFSDSQKVEESYIEHTVENLKPNIKYYLKITNNGTVVFSRTISTCGEYYFYDVREVDTEIHGFEEPYGP